MNSSRPYIEFLTFSMSFEALKKLDDKEKNEKRRQII